MAGEIQLNTTTLATESSGSITLSNVDSATNRTNLGLGSIATQNANAVAITGGSVSGASIVPTSPFSFTNKIINGNFDIWQRGTSQTSSGYGSADRWNNDHSGSSKTASQQAFTLGQTEVPGNPKYYLRHVVTSVSGAGNYCLTQQKIEGVSTLAGKTATLSFWAKADSNKNIATEFSQDFATGGSPSSSVTGIGVTTHSLTTSWQKFTTTVSIPSISGKTLGTNGNDYLHLIIWFDAGSTYNSRTNSLGNQSGTFDIAQVQLEEGTVATPFEHRPYGLELSLCQRYYQEYGYGKNGATADLTFASGMWYASTEVFVIPQLPVLMRSAPTITVPSVTNGYRFHKNSSYLDLSTFTYVGGWDGRSGMIGTTSASGGTGGHATWLSMRVSGASIKFYAEL